MAGRVIFYLGTHESSWLGRDDVGVPLMVSHNRLSKRLGPKASLPEARMPWLLDSGGFTRITDHGGYADTPTGYAAAVRRYRDEIGRLVWAAPQDWMCEDKALAKTGLTVAEHQRRTVVNLLDLRTVAADLPWTPVLQGWTRHDYLRCADLYERAGVDLAAEPAVGVGSVCKRQDTAEITAVFAALAPLGLRLHGFGVKTGGLTRYGRYLASADSLKWSDEARKVGYRRYCRGLGPLPGCTHRSCANCLIYALHWRDEEIVNLGTHGQLTLGAAS